MSFHPIILFIIFVALVFPVLSIGIARGGFSSLKEKETQYLCIFLSCFSLIALLFLYYHVESISENNKLFEQLCKEQNGAVVRTDSTRDCIKQEAYDLYQSSKINITMPK
jgi:hypothetical protein